MPLSLKTINAELARLGFNAMLAKGDGYFYFWSGDAVEWLDRTVRVPTLRSFTLQQWIEQFRILKQKNRTLLRGNMNEHEFKKHLEELAAGKPEAEHTHGGTTAAKRHGERPKTPRTKQGAKARAGAKRRSAR